MALDKTEISKLFSKAAKTYDKYAFPQRKWGQKLIEYLKREEYGDRKMRILDIGMGTGTLTLELAKIFPEAKVIGCDIAPGMVEYARKKLCSNSNIDFIIADFENLPFENNFFDLMYSNCAFQWSVNLEKALNEAVRVLNCAGMLYFTLLGPGSLKELRDAFNKLQLHFSFEHSFVDKDTLSVLLRNLVLSEYEIFFDEDIIVFEDILCFFKWLKYIGANAGLNLSQRTKSLAIGKHILSLKNHYEGNFNVTFEVFYVKVRK